jgi:hypothetical protein
LNKNNYIKIKQSNKETNARTPYTVKEDAAILKHYVESQFRDSLTKTWKHLAEKSGRTAESLRNRFKKMATRDRDMYLKRIFTRETEWAATALEKWKRESGRGRNVLGTWNALANKVLRV